MFTTISGFVRKTYLGLCLIALLGVLTYGALTELSEAAGAFIDWAVSPGIWGVLAALLMVGVVLPGVVPLVSRIVVETLEPTLRELLRPQLEESILNLRLRSPKFRDQMAQLSYSYDPDTF